MSLLALSGTNSVSGGYEIDNSLKFEADNTEYLSFANSVGENRRTWTYSTWVKKTELFGAGSVGGTLFGAYLSSNDRARIEQYGDELGLHGKISGTTAVNVRTTMRLRDTAAWYHCMVVLDTTQATETDRVKIYVNGVQETSMVSTTYPPQNYQFAINNAVNHYVGQKGDGTDYFCGYMAETYFIDGQALTPTSFGEFDDDSGIWKPKEFTGTYPSADTNHFYLNFDDSSNLGKDSSGNGKNMTSNNITAADQATDTPTNSFCTLNPLSPSVPTYNTVSEGGTQMNSLGNAWTTVWSSVPLFKGKWYAEFKRTATNNVFIGAGGIDSNLYYFNLNYVGNNGNGTTFSVGLYSINGDFYSGSGTTGSSYATNDILCLAVDQDNGAIYFRKNNDAWMGDGSNAGNPASGASRTGAQIIDWGTATVLAASIYSSGDTVQANFGGYTSFSNSTSYSDELGMGSFVYEPPASYLAICSKNLAEHG